MGFCRVVHYGEKVGATLDPDVSDKESRTIRSTSDDVGLA